MRVTENSILQKPRIRQQQVHSSTLKYLFPKILQNNEQIWYSNVQCTGSEENLDLCSFDWATDEACNHTMDAVVECYGGESTGKLSTPEQCMIDTLQEQFALSQSNLELARDELNSERDARVYDRNFAEHDSIKYVTRFCLLLLLCYC